MTVNAAGVGWPLTGARAEHRGSGLSQEVAARAHGHRGQAPGVRQGRRIIWWSPGGVCHQGCDAPPPPSGGGGGGIPLTGSLPWHHLGPVKGLEGSSWGAGGEGKRTFAVSKASEPSGGDRFARSTHGAPRPQRPHGRSAPGVCGSGRRLVHKANRHMRKWCTGGQNGAFRPPRVHRPETRVCPGRFWTKHRPGVRPRTSAQRETTVVSPLGPSLRGYCWPSSPNRRVSWTNRRWL